MYFLFALSVETFETVGISVIKFWVTCLVSNIEGQKKGKDQPSAVLDFQNIEDVSSREKLFQKKFSRYRAFYQIQRVSGD